jgi:hypothetical protein
VREWQIHQIIMNANIQIFDGIKTTKIHEILINSIDLISINNPLFAVDYVATIIENKSLSIQRRRYANR